jgi:hypothetical protein
MYKDQRLDMLCNSIFDTNKNIQSVVVINKMGRPVEKIARPRFAKQFFDNLGEPFFMQSVLQISMGMDFDEHFGPINYHISDRESLTMLIFPIEDHVILVTINKNTGPISLARKIAGVIENHKKQLQDTSMTQLEQNVSTWDRIKSD